MATGELDMLPQNDSEHQKLTFIRCRSRKRLIFMMMVIAIAVVAGLVVYGFVRLAMTSGDGGDGASENVGGGASENGGGGASENGGGGASGNATETFQQVPPDGDIGSHGHEANCNGKVLMTWDCKNSQFVFVPCKGIEQLGPRFLPANTSIIETTSLPEHEYLYPEISNGHVATVVHSNSIFMNGLYNGANVSSHRALIPSTAAIFVTVASPAHGVTTKYRLDLGRGVFSEVHTGDGFMVEVRRYAHRELTRLLVTEVVVSRTTSTLPISLSFRVNNTRPQSEDIEFVQEKPGLWSGKTREAEYPEVAGTTSVTVVYSVVPPKLTFAPTAQGTVAFFTSVSADPGEALLYYAKGMTYLSQGTLFSSHVSLWEALWQRGRIELMGNDTMAITTNAALYYLYSALPLKEDTTWPFIGLAPNGLAHGGDGEDYWGHVFWDQDTWMFPPLALLHADLGRQIVDTRLRKLSTAKLYAQMSGLRGARYPWESGFTGLNTSPSEDTTEYELHVTGDAAWMMRQYLQLTHEKRILTHDVGYEALTGIADFWVSRSVYSETKGMYEINDVMGADEWNYPVNNSVHTNVVAVQSLRTAQYAARLIGQAPDPQWDTVASNMYIDYNSTLDYHPEYENYKRGRHVKQADTILLGFPLKWNMTQSVHENDLTYYAEVTPGGPAMTWGIFAINWLRLGHRDKADAAFHKGTYNVQEPFKVWSENADGTGAYNFHTGMGGYLQSLLYGYVGMDLSDDHLDFDPQLPPNVTGMAVRDMDYLGSSLDIVFNEDKMNVTLISTGSQPLTLVLKSTAKTVDLRVGATVKTERQPARLLPQS